MKLTTRQKIIVEFIRDFIRINKVSPSIRDIRDGLNLKSESGIHVHLSNLRAAGYVDWIDGRTRTLRLVDPDRDETDKFRVTLRVLDKKADGTFQRVLIGGRRYVLDE